MTLDEAVALSLCPTLSRIGLTARLAADDPTLLELARSRLAEACEARLAAAVRGIEVASWDDPRFPTGLLATGDCPPALWHRGRLTALEAPAVAVVGSRAASASALEMAGRLGQDLAAAGITVVSGLARGVDSAAHRGALRSGLTVAVLGSGLDRVYPAEHAGLADEIAVSGLLLTEYPPGTPPLPFHFPQRNRLISGIARAVVVVEASERSGSLITAACALEQGREVMAVPGSVLGGRNRGGHALMRDGATIVEGATDVLALLGLDGGSASVPSDATTHTASMDSADPVMRAMTTGEAYDLEALSAACGLESPRLLPRLLDLELQGRVRRLVGGRFMRSARTC